MKIKECRSMVKFIVFLCFVLFLCIVPSCKKSSSQPPNGTPDIQATVEDTAEITAEQVTETTNAAIDETQETAAVDETQETTPDDSELAPINIELPEALFLGTPEDAEVENLEKPLGKPRPPFLAPVGTTNVALGKPVKSSSPIIIGEPDYITDGDKDATDGHYAQLLGGGVQYVTIDLGEMYNIYAIVVWHLHRQPLVFFDVVVQTSNDSYFIENVNTLFNNDIDNSAGLGIGKDMHYVETNEGKLIDAKGVKGRYVRLYSNGYNLEDLNYYTEVEVYGKPAK